MTFAAAALALCGLSARTLGWRPAEFWAATPAELAAALGLLSPVRLRASTGTPSSS
ncbi:phage tail assembly chaperone [Novosphingobium resinovorum]